MTDEKTVTEKFMGYTKNPPHGENSRKRSFSYDGPSSDDDLATAANSSKQARTAVTFSLRNSLLVRKKLVESVVDRVLLDHFVLVSYDLTNDDDL